MDTPKNHGTIDQFINQALEAGMPGELLALSAVHMVKTLNEVGHHDKGISLVQRLWQVLSQCAFDANKDKPQNAIDVAGMFLERYFNHQGDWNAMSRCIQENILDGHPERQQAVEKAIRETREMTLRSVAFVASGALN